MMVGDRDIYNAPLTRRDHIAIGDRSPHFNGLGLKRLGMLRASELTISSGVVTATIGHHSIDTEGDAANDDLDTINGLDSGDFLYLLPANDSRTIRIRSGAGNIYSKHQVERLAFAFASPTGTGGTRYAGGGFYFWPATDANLNQGSATVTLGASNISYAAHASLVAKQAGTADTGTVTIVVSGTSMDDEANRTTSDTETIVSDITAMSANGYFETSKKWIGQVVYTLTGSGTFAADFNYGFSKYEDFGNQDFTVTGIQVVGDAGAADTGFNIKLYHHSSSGWTYAATGFAPGGTLLASMNTDHNTEVNLANGEPFAWKRVNLNTDINGDDGEGLVVEIITGAAKAVESLSGWLNVHTAPRYMYMATTKQHLVFMKHGSNWLEL